MDLTIAEKEQLKQLARRSIESVLFGKDVPEFTPTEVLGEERGAFVTLTRKGELRGCIGYIQAILPLYKTIKEAAVQAAFRDPRFNPVQKSEWKDIDIEISVLSPLRQIKDIHEIEVGVHGLFIEKGGYSGLLLPQVATEHRWDRVVFLENTCYKAGLPPDAWKSSETNIYTFSADIF